MASSARKKSRYGKRRGRALSWYISLYIGFRIMGLALLAIMVIWLCTAPVSVYLFDAATALGKKSGLVLDELKLYGYYYTREQDLRDQLDIVKGDSLFTFSPETAMTRMMALPWVEAVEIHRVFPNQLYVFVKEKKPAAVWITPEGKPLLIDDQGKTIAPKVSGTHDYLLRIRGAGAGDHLVSLLSLLEHRHYLKQNVNVADFVGERRWDFLLRNQTHVFLPEKEPDLALNQLDTYLQNDNLIDRGVKKIDLRLPGQIIVEP